MFNNYSTNNELNINACSGGIYKTYKESWFSYLSLTGTPMKTMCQGYKYKYDENEYYQNTIILQMILVDKDYVIAELIKEDDFNKYFENKSEVLND